MVILLAACSDQTQVETPNTPNNPPLIEGIDKDLSTYYRQSVNTIEFEPKTAHDTASISNYGVNTPVDFYLNSDGIIDILWQDTASNWYLTNFNSPLDLAPLKHITLPESINPKGRYLGFSKDELKENYFLAYSKDNQYAKRDEQGNCLNEDDNNYNCNAEYWVTGFSSDGVETFSTRLFGENNLAIKEISGSETKGNPGQAAVGVVKYLPSHNKVVLYTGHLQRAPDEVRHQAGWVGVMNDDGGEVTTMGGWYSSHNFDQRIQTSPNQKLYTLAHGDAYPRSLQLTQWDVNTQKNIYTYKYYDIDNGTTGNNKTLADTGDLAIITDDLSAIAFATEDSRASRDVRLKIISGIDTGDDIQEILDIWLTEHDNTKMVGKGIKVTRLSQDKVIVAWNNYQGELPEVNTKKGDYINTTVAIYSVEGNKLSSMDINERLMPTQSIQITSDKTSAVWVTTSNDKVITAHSINLTQFGVSD